ncbi:uncharacterized protein LOC116174270 [Photinus pyralis]|uniref:uncharacterized protein LOC116174270 n=1 Tax=Photinus pyralis TaxID=7054 RepID=UPI0012676CA1|nr:uncharacterized protein LOC116174270 [Photinus pyralis]
MKTGIIAIAIFCACSAFKFDVHPDIAKSWAEMATPYMEECSVETNVNIKAGYAGILSMNFPDTHEYHCLGECVSRRWGFYDQETKAFDYQRIEDHIVGFSKEVTKECVQEYNHIEDDCEKVFSVINCVAGKISKHY